MTLDIFFPTDTKKPKLEYTSKFMMEKKQRNEWRGKRFKGLYSFVDRNSYWRGNL